MKHSVLAGVACILWSLAAHAQSTQPAAPPAEDKKPAEDLSATAGPRVNTSSAEQSAVGGNPPANNDAANNKPASPDRLQLDTTIVTGNRELPKVLYIVPWKKAEIGELPTQPFNSLLDEALQPVDRDVFRREVSYFGVITSPPAAPDATAEQQAAPAKK
jgi:hypothetical protein